MNYKSRLKFSKFWKKSQKFQKLQKMQKSTKIFEIFKKKVKTFKNCKKCKNRPEKYEKKSKNYQLSNTPFHKFQRNLMWRQNRQRWRPSSDAECKHWSTMTSYWISREFMKRRILHLFVKKVQNGKAESNKTIALLLTSHLLLLLAFCCLSSICVAEEIVNWAAIMTWLKTFLGF